MDEMLDVCVRSRRCGFERTEAVGEILVFFQEQALVGGFQITDIAIRKAPALEAYEVHAPRGGRVAIDDHERRDVLDDLCAAADDRVFSDTAKLVNGGDTGDDGMILDDDVTRDAGGVRENDTIADLAVVGDVRVTQEKVVRTDARGQFLEGAAVNGGIFPEDIMITDFEGGRFTDVFQILGFPADGCEGEKLVAFSEGGNAIQDDVGVEHTIVTERHVRANDTEWANAYVLSEFGLGGNDGCRMYHFRNSKRMPGL